MTEKSDQRKKKILFVCFGNMIRSQMAEGFGREHGSDVLEVFSAGLQPTGVVSEDAIVAMEEKGIDIKQQSSKGLDDVPLGDMDFAVGYEDATAYPAPGQILLYPKGKSETEILIAYGCVHFASKAGGLAGNHFATITSALDKLRAVGVATLWEGAKTIRFVS